MCCSVLWEIGSKEIVYILRVIVVIEGINIGGFLRVISSFPRVIGCEVFKEVQRHIVCSVTELTTKDILHETVTCMQANSSEDIHKVFNRKWHETCKGESDIGHIYG